MEEVCYGRNGIKENLQRRDRFFQRSRKMDGYSLKVKKMFEMLVDQVTSLEECSKLPKNNDQRAFIRGAWSENGEDEVEKTKDEACLVARVPDEN
ncbi:hypothetical protein Tco_0365539 [Tanacetum coccineum]